MNTIQSNAAVVQRIVSSRSDAVAAQGAASNRHEGESSDEAMMYAWSIGTTRVAQERASDRLTPRREEIPPEVYIG